MKMNPPNPRQYWVSAFFHRDFPRRKSRWKLTRKSGKKMAAFFYWLTPLKAAPLPGFSHFPS